MKTIKVIDLLSKIANGEEALSIKYRDKILCWNKEKDRFEDKDGMNTLYEMDFSELNDKVEIIEEDKAPTFNNIREQYGLPRVEEDNKIEKIPIGKYRPTHRIKKIEKKVNEIIDYINKEEK